MKLFIDDIRDAPDDSWYVARTSEAAINLIRLTEELGGVIEEIAFDHDLGYVFKDGGAKDDTTRPVMLYLIENEIYPVAVSVHTGNPVGEEWLWDMVIQYLPETESLPKRAKF